MATQELTFRIGANDAALKSVLADVRNQYGRTITEITNQTKQEAVAAVSLQRQRSAALVSQWKSDTRAHEREEKERTRASESLQRQRSAALIALWKAEAREKERIAREVQRNTERIAQGAVRGSGALSNIGSQVVGGILGGLTVATLISQVKEAAVGLANFSGRLEQARIGFTTLTGSAENATKHLKELQIFANQTPFQFEELIDASRRLQALGFTATEVIPILRDVGNAVAAVGGNAQTLDRVTIALAQMQSKGKVATQELNQIAEAGIPAWKILEDAFGKSRVELVDLVEDGKIASKVYIDAFRRFSQNNFGDAMEKQSHTFLGAISTIKDAVLLAASEAFEPTFRNLSKQLDDVSREIQNNGQEWQRWRKLIDTSVQGLDFTVGNVFRGIKAILEDIVYLQERWNSLAQATGVADQQKTLQAAAEAAKIAIGSYLSPSSQRFDDAGEFAQGQVPSERRVSPTIPASSGGSGKSERGSSAASTAVKQAIREAQEQEDVNNRLVEIYNKLQAELSGVATNTHKWAIEQEILNGKLKNADPLLQSEARETARLTDASEKQLKLQNELLTFLTKQEAAVDEVINGVKGEIAITVDFITSLEKQGAILQETTKFWLLFRAAILANHDALKMYQETLEAIGPLLASVGEGAGLGDDAIAALAGAKADATAGLPPLPDAEEFNARQAAITAGLDAMREGFAGLADAANSAIDSFIKFGTAGIGFRKFVAEIISGIARIAVTKAIFHLAEGFAALAFAFFGMPNAGPSAAAHFQAAALYGAIAGVAAIAGRVTAGGAFTQESSGAASGAFNSSTGGGRGGSGSSTAPKPMEADRRSYSTQPIVRELRLTVNGDAVIDRFVEDFDLNGRTRIIVSSGG